MPTVPAIRLAHRLAALALLLTLMPVAYAGAACAGWSSSAAERMACCQRADGGCASLSADDCCGAQEERQNPEAGVVMVVMPRPTPFLLVPTFSESRRASPRGLRVLNSLPATHLLNSVFLI